MAIHSVREYLNKKGRLERLQKEVSRFEEELTKSKKRRITVDDGVFKPVSPIHDLCIVCFLFSTLAYPSPHTGFLKKTTTFNANGLNPVFLMLEIDDYESRIVVTSCCITGL